MPRRHRSHSTEFKRQVVAEYHAGKTLHALSRRHDLSWNLVRVWVEKAEAGVASTLVRLHPYICQQRQDFLAA